MITIVDFYAEWCGPCKVIAPILDQIVENNENLNLKKINVDLPESKDLVTEHSVRSIPTLLFMKDNTVLHKHVGSISKVKLEELLNTL